MANTTLSPNMNLVVPTVGVDPGPDWANNLNASLNIIDSHNHSAGQGVQISPAGLDINSDLTMQVNNLTDTKSVIFEAQNSPLSGGAYIGCIYVSGKDLYYNDEDGNQVRITTGGNVNAGAGSITGLPSGTASASFGGGAFTWRSATNTPATMNVGPLVVGAATLNSNTVTISPLTSLAASYSMTFPAALPAATSIYAVSAAGAQNFTAPDNASFGVSGGTYQVLDLGITTAKIAASAVTTAKIADAAVTNAKLATLNYNAGAGGSSIALTSTSFVDLGSLAGTLTSVGRPVVLFLTTQLNASTAGSINFTGGASRLDLQLIRNGTVIQSTTQSDNAGSLIMIPGWMMMDLGPAVGVNAYKLQGKVNAGTVTFAYCYLIFWEL